jgi:hypothetical protein
VSRAKVWQKLKRIAYTRACVLQQSTDSRPQRFNDYDYTQDFDMGVAKCSVNNIGKSAIVSILAESAIVSMQQHWRAHPTQMQLAVPPNSKT